MRNRELEVFTMKKIITVTLCIVLVLLFAGCGKNGDTSKVEIDYGASSVYSKEEIDSAIEIIKKQFASFEGCELPRCRHMSVCIKSITVQKIRVFHTEFLCPCIHFCYKFFLTARWHGRLATHSGYSR